jgi:hypothetical protein
MTREPKEPPSTLQKWNEATPRDIVTELERLALVPAFWRPDMDPRKWAMLFETYHEDLRGLSVEQIRSGCKAWRNNPDNTKFPTPGQLREACDPLKTSSGRQRETFRATPEEHARAAAERAELDAWVRSRLAKKQA